MCAATIKHKIPHLPTTTQLSLKNCQAFLIEYPQVSLPSVPDLMHAFDRDLTHAFDHDLMHYALTYSMLVVVSSLETHVLTQCVSAIHLSGTRTALPGTTCARAHRQQICAGPGPAATYS